MRQVLVTVAAVVGLTALVAGPAAASGQPPPAAAGQPRPAAGPVLQSTPPGGEAGVAYAAPLTVPRGSAPYTVAVTAGALPPGLTLQPPTAASAGGSITGTPSAPGTYDFTLTVTGAHGHANAFPESVVVVTAAHLRGGALPAARTGIAYRATVAVTGGQAPYTWSVASGALPAGLALDASTGEITGIPDLAGSTSATIGVADAYGGTASATRTLAVALWKPPLVPSGSLLGASVYPDHTRPKAGQIDTFERQIGRVLDIDNNYYGFASALVGANTSADEAAGRIPLDSWTCGNPDTVLSGADDQQLEAQAAAVEAFGYPIYLRYSWEMDQGANAACANADGPAAFRAAWRHIWTIFHRAGATNAAWVWCPSHEAFANGTATEYYPGDAYVDYACADGYSRSATSPTSFADIFAALYQGWSARKPILIGETGQVPGALQAGWITQAGDQVRSELPDVKALLYFDSHGAVDYAITSPASLRAFSELAHRAWFNPLGKSAP